MAESGGSAVQKSAAQCSAGSAAYSEEQSAHVPTPFNEPTNQPTNDNKPTKLVWPVTLCWQGCEVGVLLRCSFLFLEVLACSAPQQSNTKTPHTHTCICLTV